MMNNFQLGSNLGGGRPGGRVRVLSRDPPGQRSVYIPPGNDEEESYRATTYARFPHGRVNTRELAKYGFCYVGYKDRVKCFSCGISVEDWTENDNPASPEFHNRTCEFYTGVPGRNKPITTRLSLFNRHSSRQLRPQVVADAHGGGPVVVPPSPQQPHNIPAGQVLLNQPSTIPGNATAGNEQANNGAAELNPMNLQQLFPCTNPVNPHMRSIEARMATYEVGWQSDRVRATPRQLAESGMYYLGERDRVKCWYCNGGLQNWEFEDEPWFEHAKWFPQCEFILQKKGPTFVHNVVARFPNIRRPPIRNPTQRQVVSGLNVFRDPTGRRLQRLHRPPPPDAPPKIIDPREEMRIIRRKVRKEMNESSLVENAIQMGFERKVIKAAVKRKLESTSSTFDRFEQLIESILNHTEDVPSDESDADDEAAPSRTPSVTEDMEVSSSQEPISPRDEIKQLEDSKKCKFCGEKNIGIVFLPCGHLASCVECSVDARFCPICKVAISEKVRVFSS